MCVSYGLRPLTLFVLLDFRVKIPLVLQAILSVLLAQDFQPFANDALQFQF